MPRCGDRSIGGTAPASGCTVAPGSYCGPGAAVPSVPNACTAGSYCTGAAAAPVACACAAGTACPAASILRVNCVTCVPGYYCVGTASAAAPCAAGKYGATAGLSASGCTGACTCAAGSYCPLASTSASGVPCSAGYFCSGGATVSAACTCMRAARLRARLHEGFACVLCGSRPCMLLSVVMFYCTLFVCFFLPACARARVRARAHVSCLGHPDVRSVTIECRRAGLVLSPRFIDHQRRRLPHRPLLCGRRRAAGFHVLHRNARRRVRVQHDGADADERELELHGRQPVVHVLHELLWRCARAPRTHLKLRSAGLSAWSACAHADTPDRSVCFDTAMSGKGAGVCQKSTVPAYANCGVSGSATWSLLNGTNPCGGLVYSVPGGNSAPCVPAVARKSLVYVTCDMTVPGLAFSSMTENPQCTCVVGRGARVCAALVLP